MKNKIFCVEVEIDEDKYLKLEFKAGMEVLGGIVTAVRFGPLDEEEEESPQQAELEEARAEIQSHNIEKDKYRRAFRLLAKAYGHVIREPKEEVIKDENGVSEAFDSTVGVGVTAHESPGRGRPWPGRDPDGKGCDVRLGQGNCPHGQVVDRPCKG